MYDWAIIVIVIKHYAAQLRELPQTGIAQHRVDLVRYASEP
ncbi:MAG: hypothetical protein ACI9G1_004816 [Pirellulaceae bacterium]